MTTFEQWMKSKRLSDSTILKYSGAINGVLSEWALTAGIITDSIPSISDSSQFEHVANSISKLPVFLDRNATGHTMYSNALKKYGQFLQENTNPGSKSVPSTIAQPKTYLFTWNPDKWEWVDLPQAVFEANAEGHFVDKWSCSNRNMTIGDRAFLIRLGVHPKGIMGSGVIISDPYENIHWDSKKAAKGEKTHYVDILFDVLSDLPVLTGDELTSNIKGKFKWFSQSSGIEIRGEIAKQLDELWSQATGTVFTTVEREDIPRVRTEGTKKSRLVTVYERNSEARDECLKHHGRTCQVCEFIFEKQYGKIGEKFIHVHHKVPVSAIGQAYKINPVKDLAPVCPNCHAMLHKKTPPYQIEELKAIMNALNC